MAPARRHKENDCALVALATYLGRPYTVVLEACLLARGHNGDDGLSRGDITGTAAWLGVRLRYVREVNLDRDFCILDLSQHVAVLRRGLLWEPDGAVWQIHDYLRLESLTPLGAFVRAEDLPCCR